MRKAIIDMFSLINVLDLIHLLPTIVLHTRLLPEMPVTILLRELPCSSLVIS
jgi:hypothetical protein